MNIKRYSILDYEDVLITDKNGMVVFYDLANFSFFDLKPDKIVGRKVTELYKNLVDNESTIINVLKTGNPICNYKQELITMKNNTVFQISSTYPIKENDEVIGVIEFSKCLYTKDSLTHIRKHSEHKVYRKNNTIYKLNDIITQDEKMQEILSNLYRISSTPSSVFIYGETGTGKEMVAQAIHNLSRRCNRPFISQNCAAIPETLFESILFGTEEGSYTGAVSKKGLFELANGGTLFLDEINTIYPYIQAKLLKVIEEKKIRRIGGVKLIDIDVKIITASNIKPIELINNGDLREDLYYRLGVVQINLPPLRERRGDIEILIEHFINYYNRRMNFKLKGISDRVKKACLNYKWPGNIRELKNMIESAYNYAKGDVIQYRDIPKWINLKSQKNIDYDFYENVKNYEIHLLKKALEECNYNISQAGRKLNLSKQTTWNKIKKYGIKV